MRSLDSCIRKLVLTRVCLFFSSYAHRFQPTHACEIQQMQPHSCASMAPSRNPSLGISTPFSSILHLFAILTSFLTIFASNCMSHVISHSIMNPISLSHYSFHLIMNLTHSFCKFYLHILVEEVPVRHWYGTASLPRKLVVTFVLWALSSSFACCLRGLLVLCWRRL